MNILIKKAATLLMCIAMLLMLNPGTALTSPGILANDMMVEISDPVDEAARPRFSIPNVTFIPENPNLTAPFTLNIILLNIGNADARDLTVSLDGGTNFAVTTLTNRVHLPLVTWGTGAVASFQIRARQGRESNEVNLTLSYGTHTQIETLNLPLPDVQEAPVPQPPALSVSSFTVQLAQDGQFALNLTIRNTGMTEARNIMVSIDGGDRAFPAGGVNTRLITSIFPGTTATVAYLLTPRGELFNHPVNIAFNFVDPDGKVFTNNDRIFISSNLEPSLKITGFSARPEGDDGRFLLNLQLQNLGRSLARDISVRFTGTQAFPLDGSNLFRVSDLTAGLYAQLSIMMKAGAESETYSVPVDITYRSIGGAEYSTSETMVLTAASIGVDIPPPEQEQRGTPRVMLERHTLSTEQVLAGGTFTLTLYVRNNADRAVGNMKISLGSIQVGGAGSGGTGGTVFSPLGGSSSSFFVEKIAANGLLIKKVNLFVDPNAAAMTYSLPITIEYEDTDGNPFNVNEAVNIPVLQESRIQVLSMDIPTIASVGQAVPLSMEFANTGRVALNNVLVAIEGDFPTENATYFIPRLEIGLSDFFQGMIIPENEGELSGNLIITFLDGRNQEVRIDHPFTMQVQAMEPPVETPDTPFPGTEQPGAGISWMTILLGGAGAVALIITAVFLIKKIRVKRHEALFDEKI